MLNLDGSGLGSAWFGDVFGLGVVDGGLGGVAGFGVPGGDGGGGAEDVARGRGVVGVLEDNVAAGLPG